MIILYPSEPYDLKKVDPCYDDEYRLFKMAGYDVRLMDYDGFVQHSGLKVYPKIESKGDKPNIVLYRGWMMDDRQYARFCRQLYTIGAVPFVGCESYLNAHWVSRWYEPLKHVTAPTQIIPSARFSVIPVLGELLDELDWTQPKFLKDYVKSNNGALGSIAINSAKAKAIFCELDYYRGHLEGGVCLRDVRKFIPESEERFFVALGVPYSATNQAVPDVVTVAAQAIDSPFFSVDVATREDGVVEIVEVGDGQVSDTKNWERLPFSAIITTLIEEVDLVN